MLSAVVCLAILLVLADKIFAFAMEAGVVAFWSAVAIGLAAFAAGVWVEPYLLLVPPLFIAIVLLYARLQYSIADHLAVRTKRGNQEK